jgi:hypothetical protein
MKTAKIENAELTLREYVSLYVPSTEYNTESTELGETWKLNTLREFANLFGGSTAFLSAGAYVAGNGELIQEKINIVKSFTTGETLLAKLHNVLNFAKQLKLAMKQETIGIEINGTFYLV